MGILRITVDDSARVAATRAKLHLTIKGATAVLGNAAVKRATEVRELVAALADVGVEEDQVEVAGVRIASAANLLGRNQKVEITLVVSAEPGALPGLLGVLTDRPNLTLDDLEWVYDTFEASIPLAAQAMVKARRKADAVAAAAGLRVTGVENASDSWSMPAPRQAMAFDAALSSRAKATPELDLGLEFSSTTEITVHLSVDFQVAETAALP